MADIREWINLIGVVIQAIAIVGGVYWALFQSKVQNVELVSKLESRQIELNKSLESKTTDLNRSIEGLAKSVDKLGSAIEKIREIQNNHEVRITVLEQQRSDK